MLIEIPRLLSRTQLDAVRSVLHQSTFVDGSLSAGLNARKNKHNEEADSDTDQYHALNDVVMTSLVRHPEYLSAALPVRIASPIYARYTKGMQYGSHIDDPVMGGSVRYRADISITVFLSDPDQYEGGELCIQTITGEQRCKLAAGSALLYPSSSRHAVAPVTGGERLVAVTWVQSMVRDPDKRQILYKLDKVRQQLDRHADPHNYDLLDDSYTNLVRMWAEV